MKLLVFAGAGTSIELGVPAMEGLAIEFLRHAKEWDVEPKLVEQLMNSSNDIEVLIENLDSIYAASQSLVMIKETIESQSSIEKIRSEVEWFVQHAAERVVPSDCQLVWGALLRLTASHDITFATTNYDRAIELAANSEGISLADGFSQFGVSETAVWSAPTDYTSGDLLIKLHGSTDWYTVAGDGSPVKLRHPMPLFGSATLGLSENLKLGSALILPSRNKLLTKSPYPRLSQWFLTAIDNCEIAVIVGASLRDTHVRDAIESIAGKRPVFIVNPEGNSHGITNAISIGHSASQFLISTLPYALTKPDPVGVLVEYGKMEPQPNSNILELLKMALDTQDDKDRRCDAIEELHRLAVSLDNELVSELLSDEVIEISQNALGLVINAHNPADIVKDLNQLPYLGDEEYAAEVSLLQSMIQNEEAA